MASRYAAQPVNISGATAAYSGQNFAGINNGTINFAAGRNQADSAAICQAALYLTEPDAVRNGLISAKGDRVAGTCEWILQNQTYRTWLTDDGDGVNDDDVPKANLLWISGGPGKGKTMMSIFLTEELARYTADMESTDLIFFFCGADDENRNSAVQVLRGLVYQIIGKRPQLAEHALPYLPNERKEQTISNFEILWLIFSKLIADDRLGTMFCVIDGLDECEGDTMQTLSQNFLKLAKKGKSISTGSDFRLAIVSRDIAALRRCSTVRLDPDNNEEIDRDISTFVRIRVKDLSHIQGFEDIQKSVQDILLERAGGTFLWVGFAMHELLQNRTCSEIWDTLADLPSGLPAVYGRMLLRIPSKQRDLCRKILRYVTAAIIPLRLMELATAVGISEGHPQLSIEQVAHDAVVLCGPMLRLQDRSPRPQSHHWPRMDQPEFVGGYEVVLVHQSARDYLLRGDCDSAEALDTFNFDAASTHFELAQTCLDCIAQSPLQHNLIDVRKDPESRESPLLRYAVFYWTEHVKQCSTLTQGLFKTHRLFRDRNNILRSNWWCVYADTLNSEHVPPLLSMATRLGLTSLVKVILAQRDYGIGRYRRINKRSLYQTALSLAISGGKLDIVQLLLKEGASTEVKLDRKKTALHYAFIEESNDAVRQLVAAGARIDARDYRKETPLHIAASLGRQIGARILLDNGADARAKNDRGKTVLHYAAESGSEATVQLILERGADPKAKTEHGKTVLHSAAEGRSEAVVRLILNTQADPGAEIIFGKTVLHYAAENGDEAVVRLLLREGADLKAKTAVGTTVLHTAALSSSPTLVRFLIEEGADVTAKDREERTPLHLAVYDGNLEAMQLLIDRGADVNARTSSGVTPLHIAVQLLFWAEGVRLLLDRGADIDARDKMGNTPLIKSARGYPWTMQLLLDRGADPGSKNQLGHTALYAAVAGKIDLFDHISDDVRLLIGKGANVEELNKKAAYRNCKRALRERSDDWEYIKTERSDDFEYIKTDHDDRF